MKMKSVLVVAACLGAPPLAASEPPGSWTGFRGAGDSHSDAKLPLSWPDRHNIAWKIRTPGFGQSDDAMNGLSTMVGNRVEPDLQSRAGRERLRYFRKHEEVRGGSDGV